MKYQRFLAVLLMISLLLSTLCACALRVPEPQEMSSADEAQAMGFSKGDAVEELPKGEYAYFGINIKIDYEYEVKWTTSNPEVAVVDSNGRVDALSEGEAVITASAKKATVDFPLTVTKPKSVTYYNTTAFTANKSTVEQNLSGNSNNAPYALLVNLKTNCVTAYTYNAYGIYNIAVRSMVCAVGSGSKTPENSYTLSSKDRWYSSDGKYYQYVSEFKESEGTAYRICSAPYSEESADTLISKEYNKLGTACTSGDIWLSAADAQWVYDNCSEGTLVKVTHFDSGDPLGVPESMKLNDKSKAKNWDPTDSHEDNPYSKLRPTFSGVEDKYVVVNGTFDAYEGVVAYDICGNAFTEDITVDGSVPCNKEGSYVISYFFTDIMGRTARADRTVTVLSEEDFANLISN